MSENVTTGKGTLGIVAEMSVCHEDGRISAHLSFGRIIDALAQEYDKVLLCAPTRSEDPEHTRDYVLQADNIELIPQPMYSSSLSALKHPGAIAGAYAKTLKGAEHIFVRGMLPFSGLFYFLASIYRRKPVHWIVGNPVALLRSHRRDGYLKDALGIAYAYQDRFFNRLGRRLTGGAFVCNGDELANIYKSPRTQAVVSTTITKDEFFVRDDTCLQEPIKMLFVGFVRPEKGLEYLIEALPKLKCGRDWQLTIIGSWDGFADYKTALDVRIDNLGIREKINWGGYVSYGPDLWGFLRNHDIFVLPTLSEGTPRVLVEARANSIPIIATSVGGIPTSVTDGKDGILVPPKDSDAIAGAIDKIVADGDFRRNLIASGLQSARQMTIEHFIARVTGEL